MRKFSNTDKKIIDVILQKSIQEMPIVYMFLKQYFTENKMALFLSSSYDKVFILYKDDIDYRDAFALIVEFVSLLETMEKEGYLYFVNIDNDEPILLYEQLDITVGINADNRSFTISSGSLYLYDETITLKNKVGEIVLNGKSCQKQLANKISYYFKSIAYPSKSLRIFVDNNYESLEVLSYERDIKNAIFSRNMAWGALILSLFLPFGMTFFNNEFAKTEIKDSQYHSTLHKIDIISEKIDTVSKYLILEQKKHDISKISTSTNKFPNTQ